MNDQPCEWPIIWPGGLEPTEEEQATWGPVAAQIVWALSGRRYGRCRRWVRPIAASSGGAWCEPRIIDGRWFNAAGRSTLLQLPRPTLEVHGVRIGSVELAPVNYRKVGDALIKLDGKPWPAQRLEAAEGTDGWWAVELTTGFPVPPGGQVAAGILAGELVRARRGSGKCRLPARAQSVAREGVDVQLLDPAALYEAGLTGLPEVDQCITAVNPGGLTSAPSVTSPDHPMYQMRRVQCPHRPRRPAGRGWWRCSLGCSTPPARSCPRPRPGRSGRG